MRTERLRGALKHLCLADGGLTDGQLLARFLDGREEAAFAALVRRHGPMVLGVCRRVLGHAQDAEDAFQATFLVLARKAGSVVRREAVGAFLYGVAYRTALRAREKAARRRAVETQVEQMPHPEVPPDEPQDWRPVLDRELNHLPEKYRAALLLCDLGGKTRREAARQLDVPEGTVATRLATARRMLAKRLARCGVVLSGGALAVALAGGASAAVPAPLAAATVKAAALVAAGQAAAAGTPAVALMNEVLRAMLMTKLKTYAGVVLVAALLGAGGIAYRAAGQAPATDARPLTELELLRREVDILKLQMELVQEKQRAQEAELRALRGRRGRPGTAPVGPLNAYPVPGATGADLPAGKSPSAAPGPKGPMPDPALPRMPGPAGPSLPNANNLIPGPDVFRPAPAPETNSKPVLPNAPADRPAEEVPALPAPPARDTEVRPPVSADSTNGAPAPGPAPTSTAPDPGLTLPATSADQPDAGAPEAPVQQMEAAVRALRQARGEPARRRALDELEKALKDLREQQKPAKRAPAS
jgi:RNA polymerase sigma factor (sigma-70 family)